MNYLDCRRIVHGLILKHHVLRDNDYKLVVAVWNRELLEQDISIREISGYDAFKLVSDGKVSPVESITRCRRKLQEEFPALRGARYNERHGIETEVKEELGY